MGRKMRVLKSILLFAAVSTDEPDDAHLPLEKRDDLGKRHSYNRLVTISRLINRHCVAAKGGNPDGGENYGLEDRPNRVERINNGMRINNVFFNRNLKKMFFKENKDGELKCAQHTKSRRGGGRRKRRSLTLDQDDWENYCDMLEEAHDPLDGPCTDCCDKDENGNYVLGSSVRGIKTMGDFNAEDPEDFVKKSRKLYTVLKKWIDTYLSECRGNKQRYTRIANFLTNRLWNGIDQGYTTMDAIESGRWKRVFPKGEEYENEGLDKHTMIAKLKQRMEDNGMTVDE